MSLVEAGLPPLRASRVAIFNERVDITGGALNTIVIALFVSRGCGPNQMSGRLWSLMALA